ncbi:hypothetical protein [Streptacidiphilus carbonis]|uniref:hypothetical protein n=1 Tax=Streptacidiphilus carbonis TaxID=105422 RepID=UPI0005A8D5BA|nr:hypothetical protein [Streptacidiphilus carbonis]
MSPAAPAESDELLFEFSGTITDYWSYTMVRDYVMLMPGMTHTAYRLYGLLRSMMTEASRRPRSGMRRMTIDQLCWLLPGPNDKSMSISAMYDVLKTLADLNLVVPKDTVELAGITALKGKMRAAQGISRGFTVNDLPPDAEHVGWRNAWDKLDAYTPNWRDAPPQAPTHLTEVETAANGQSLARVRLVDASGQPFQKTGTLPDAGDAEPSFQKTGRAFQKTGTLDQKTGTDLPLTSENDHPLRSSLKEASLSAAPGAPSAPSVPVEVLGGEEISASPENGTGAPADAGAPDTHDDVRVAEAWIESRQKHGHPVPARGRSAMIRDAALLLAEGLVDVEHLVAAAADMGSRANWYSLPRHLERFVLPTMLPGQRPALPDWCGKCNDGNEPVQSGQRLREDDDGSLVRCECHPSHPSHAKTPVLA